MSGVLEACPHCGGTSGLYLTYHQTYNQYFGWDGLNLGPSEEDGPIPKIARCMDCQKQVTKQARQIHPFNNYGGGIGVHNDMGETIL